MAEHNRTDTRIDALLARMDGLDGAEAESLRAEVHWLVGRYHRLDRNLNKISRMSDRLQAEIMQLNDKLRDASVTDPLTGLINRRGAHDGLQAEMTAVQNGDSKGFCLTLIDIDFFKGVNDTHGHDVGDEVLVNFSTRLTSAMRETDLIARWGGEEFLVLLRETGLGDAVALLEGFHENLRNRAVKTAVGPLTVTASSGLCQYDVRDDGYDSTIFRADQALYAAKEGGRDQWLLAEDPTAE